MNDNGDTMVIYTEIGTVELPQTAVTDTDVVYAAEVYMTIAGEDIKVEYLLFYSILNGGTIDGRLISHLLAFDGNTNQKVPKGAFWDSGTD